MADRDEFGLQIGSAVSKAASLAARPTGSTMGEILDATGDTKYNIFKRLEAMGHLVRREGKGLGMRIWLKHKDATSDGDAALDDDLVEESVSEPEVEQFTLSLERDLQRALRGSLDQLEPGLVAVDGGREQGFRDITAKDQAGDIVIIELKAGKAGAEAVSQLLAYMGEVKAQQSLSVVRGILIARDFQLKAMAAASVVPNVILKRYKFHLTFADADASPAST